MTNEKAIKLIDIVRDCSGYRNTENFLWTDAFNKAIEALEKQTPKKPIFSHEREFAHDKVYKCPACGGMLGTKLINQYSEMIGCGRCLQAIDWSEVE